jgi:hypothetical protein
VEVYIKNLIYIFIKLLKHKNVIKYNDLIRWFIYFDISFSLQISLCNMLLF